MRYRTPNIDRIANEGIRFTDSYWKQSCTAGIAAFITGQSVLYRIEQGGNTRSQRGNSSRRPYNRRTAETAGLCHRTVWKEPFWRPGRISAH
nr:sulfatase-like hydrolase/transferase [Methanosarcina barkeri]